MRTPSLTPTPLTHPLVARVEKACGKADARLVAELLRALEYAAQEVDRLGNGRENLFLESMTDLLKRLKEPT